MTAKLYIGVFMLLAGTLYSCQKDEEVNKLDADYLSLIHISEPTRH